MAAKRLLSYHVGNLQGVGSRARQEDSFAFANIFDVKAIRDDGLLFVVCDGMGGMKDGSIASDTAVKSFRASFAAMNKNANIASQLRESVFRASAEVERIIGGQGGSTCIVGIIYQDNLYYASVGDSYMYLKRGDNLYRLNQEHNLCNEIYLDCIRAGDIDPSEGRNDPETASLTSFLGMTGIEDVDSSVRPLPMKAGDIILACSDGVGGVVDENEILNAMRVDDPQQMCDQIGQRVVFHNRPNQDNYTAVIVKCCD